MLCPGAINVFNPEWRENNKRRPVVELSGAKWACRDERPMQSKRLASELPAMRTFHANTPHNTALRGANDRLATRTGRDISTTLNRLLPQRQQALNSCRDQLPLRPCLQGPRSGLDGWPASHAWQATELGR